VVLGQVKLSRNPSTPGAIGTDDHDAPFQCSAIGESRAGELTAPTAQQSELVTQATSPKAAVWELLGFTKDHDEPSQCAMRADRGKPVLKF
jgi:hypothetical protein